MYESFYGLSAKPFQLSPDSRFYFASRQHQRAVDFLEYGLQQNEGFIVVTGEVGAGKTTVVQGLLGRIDAAKVVAAHLVSTQLEADDLLRMVAAAFGIKTRDLSKADVLLAIEAHLTSVARAQKRCVLIVDEAQNLSHRAVEELRMLSNFQLGSRALLQSFLVGQPEFRAILQGPEMHQLRQRVIAACHIGPLDKSETRDYVEHRMRCAGWKRDPQFRRAAFDALFEASGGVPRRINLICDRLLLWGYLGGKRVFTRQSVEEVARELDSETMGAPALAPAMPAREETVVEARRPRRKRRARASEGSVEPKPAAAPPPSPAEPQPQAPGAAGDLRGLEASLVRVEEGNRETRDLLRRFLDWVKSRENRRTDVA